jgi:hypothetical protein
MLLSLSLFPVENMSLRGLNMVGKSHLGKNLRYYVNHYLHCEYSVLNTEQARSSVLKVVTNEKGEAVGKVVTIIC